MFHPVNPKNLTTYCFSKLTHHLGQCLSHFTHHSGKSEYQSIQLETVHPFLKKKIYSSVCFCMCMAHSARACRLQRRWLGLTWVLGTRLQSSRRAEVLSLLLHLSSLKHIQVQFAVNHSFIKISLI